jgi:diguanylate cyclase (GGDEF)-like protein
MRGFDCHGSERKDTRQPHVTTETSSRSPSLPQTLARDPWVFTGGLLCLLITLVYAVPLLAGAEMDFFTNHLTSIVGLILVVAATFSGLLRIEHVEERRLWARIAIAFGFWATAEVFTASGLTDPIEAAGSLFLDCLYLLYYLWWIFALQARPQLTSKRRSSEYSRDFSWAGRVLFAAGLFIYFIFLPRVILPEAYITWIPSFLFYIALDLYIAGRLAFLWATQETPRWRLIYWLLCVGALLLAVTDIIDAMWTGGWIEPASPGFADIRWFVPLFIIVVAARARHHQFTAAATEPGAPRDYQVKGVPLMAYSFAFPVLHFTLHIFEKTSPRLESAREILVFGWMLLLGGLNLAQHLYLQTWTRQLQARRREAEEKVLYLSQRDVLTGLLNRRELLAVLGKAIARSKRGRQRMAVLFIDLDGFKKINDTLGHSVGDSVLSAVADRLRLCVRETDTLSRYGGDEFVLILETFDDDRYAAEIALRILTMLSHDLVVDDRPFELSASIGIGLHPADGETPQMLIDASDRAMYKAKAGGGQYRFAHEPESPDSPSHGVPRSDAG